MAHRNVYIDRPKGRRNHQGSEQSESVDQLKSAPFRRARRIDSNELSKFTMELENDTKLSYEQLMVVKSAVCNYHNALSAGNVETMVDLVRFALMDRHAGFDVISAISRCCKAVYEDLYLDSIKFPADIYKIIKEMDSKTITNFWGYAETMTGLDEKGLSTNPLVQKITDMATKSGDKLFWKHVILAIMCAWYVKDAGDLPAQVDKTLTFCREKKITSAMMTSLSYSIQFLTTKQAESGFCAMIDYMRDNNFTSAKTEALRIAINNHESAMRASIPSIADIK
jgi:hypothetical protein